jgi:LPS export ABC transporter protein LptC
MGRNFKIFLLILIFLPVFEISGFTLDLSNFKPQVKIEDVEYVIFKDGKLEWKLKAKKIWKNNKGDLWGEDLNFINTKKNIEIESGEGFYLAKKKEFILIKNVILKTSDNKTILTQELKFYPEKGIIISNKEVEVQEKRMIVKGEGFVYFVDSGDLKIKKKAQVKVKF